MDKKTVTVADCHCNRCHCNRSSLLRQSDQSFISPHPKTDKKGRKRERQKGDEKQKLRMGRGDKKTDDDDEDGEEGEEGFDVPRTNWRMARTRDLTEGFFS